MIRCTDGTSVTAVVRTLGSTVARTGSPCATASATSWSTSSHVTIGVMGESSRRPPTMRRIASNASVPADSMLSNAAAAAAG